MTTAPQGTIIAYNGYQAGLGNRVRVVLGAQSLAELEGRRLRYVWPTGARFGPRLSELWEVREARVPRAVSRLLAARYPYRDATLDWLDDDVRREPVWQIRTGAELQLPAAARPWTERYRELRPVEPIADRVQRFAAEHLGEEPYVGVMVRAHAVSHAVTREVSPVSWFLDRMRAIAADRPGTRFFVSCDVPEVQAELVATVPGAVGQPDKGSYNSTPGVQAAVADLYLLAGAGHLVGPHYSSFLHLAQHLAGDRVPVETAATGSPAEVDPAALGTAPDPLRPAVRTVGRLV